VLLLLVAAPFFIGDNMPDVRSNTAFTGQSQRCQLSTRAETLIAISATAKNVWCIDSAEAGGVNASLTIFNSGATDIVLTAFVCNDNDYIPSAAGRVALTALFSEADASIALPLTIAAGATDYVIFGYKNQPMLTTFRYWNFVLATASGVSTASVFGNVH
jgi:hypothetical protein